MPPRAKKAKSALTSPQEETLDLKFEMTGMQKFTSGDIVQVRGHGRAMVVVNPDLGIEVTWEGIPHAVVCEWAQDGAVMYEGYAAEHLEVVGSVRRRSSAEFYAWMTEKAEKVISQLTAAWQSDGAPTLIVRRSMAIGALRLWLEQAGPAVRSEDLERLQALIDGLPESTTALAAS